MRITYTKDTDINALAVMRKAGYTHFVDPNTNEESFVLRTGPEFYPRFHVYVHESPKTIGIDLHLDQKKPQYKGTRAHNGEYDGPIIEREIARIAGWMKAAYGILPSSSDALEATLQPEPTIARQNQQGGEYKSQTTYHPPENAPEKNAKLFGGIF